MWSPGVVVVARARCLGDVIGRRRVIRKRLAPRYDDEADAETGEEGPAGGVFGRLFDHEPEGDLAAAAHAAGSAAKAGGEHHTGAAAALESAPDEAALRNEARADGRGISSCVRDRGPPRARSVYLAGRRRRSRAWRGRDDATSPAGQSKRAQRAARTQHATAVRATSITTTPPQNPTHYPRPQHTRTRPPTQTTLHPARSKTRDDDQASTSRTAPRARSTPPSAPPDRPRATDDGDGATRRRGAARDPRRGVRVRPGQCSVAARAGGAPPRGACLAVTRTGLCGARARSVWFAARQSTVLMFGEAAHHLLCSAREPTIVCSARHNPLCFSATCRLSAREVWRLPREAPRRV